MFRDLLRRDLVAGASASPQFSLAQSRELKTRPSVSAVARSLARRAPPRARRRPLLSGNGARRPRCRAARRARRGMSADRHPMPRAAVPRRRAASPVYAAPCSDTPLLVRIIDRSIPLQTRWATARATKRPRPASAGSGRRSARAACSASAGRCASVPGKADGAVCRLSESALICQCAAAVRWKHQTVSRAGLLCRALGHSGPHPSS